MKKLYIMLTKTDSVFCTLITLYTKEPYAHVSLIFSDDFAYGYSFSRKNINNPFIGTLKCEDYVKWCNKFPLTYCRMYELPLADEVYNKVYTKVQSFYAEKEKYKYNLPGVIGNLFHIKIEPKNRYFCSQFAAYILSSTNALTFDKEPIFTTAGDFRVHKSLIPIYEGYLTSLLADPSLRLVA